MSDSPDRDRHRFFGKGILATLAAAGSVLRPGTTVPAGSSPLVGAPAHGVARRSAPGRLRRSLRACMAEGMLAEVVTACAGGSVLTGWALYLGFSPMLVGALGAIPIVAQTCHLPAAWLTQAVGRRRLAIAANLAARLCWLLLPLLVLAEVSTATAQRALLGVAAVSSILGIVGNNAWAAWMGDLVPGTVRGRYFGMRMALATLAGTTAAMAAAIALDLSRPYGLEAHTLAALSVVASAAGIGCALLMTRQHEPGGEVRSARFDAEAMLAAVRDPQARGFLVYQVCWNASVGIGASFFAYHMLANLEMGFVLTALHGAAVAAVRMLTAPLWGRAIDRVGARPVLAVTSVGIAIVPALWLLPTAEHLWPLTFEAALAGLLWSGHGLAVFGLPLKVAPRNGRPYYLGAFATAAGLSFGAASLVGGTIAELLPPRVELFGFWLWDLQVLFLLSAIARAGAGLLALRVVEPQARPVGALVRYAVGRARTAA